MCNHHLRSRRRGIDSWLSAGQTSSAKPSIARRRAIGPVETWRGGSGGTASVDTHGCEDAPRATIMSGSAERDFDDDALDYWHGHFSSLQGKE
jgi:hypothetical protein